MSKKVVAIIKLALPAGKATASPPVGPALGQHGVNIAAFVKEYNARTNGQGDLIIPVEISVFEDRSFNFILKTPPASVLLAKAAGIKKGSAQPNKQNGGSINLQDIEEIAKTKMPDLNANDLEAAIKIISGTAKSMGLKVIS